MALHDHIKFNLAEISSATGIPIRTELGISYGVLKLDIPLANGGVLCFREGDDDNDHEVIVRDQVSYLRTI